MIPLKKKIICTGGACIDYKLKALHPVIAHTSNPVTTHISLGGVARNVARNLANLTDSIALQCVVGDDIDGQHLLSDAQIQQIDISSSLTLKNQPTARYFSFLDQEGELQIAGAAMEIVDHIPQHARQHWCRDWPLNAIIFLDTNLPHDLLNTIISWSASHNMVIGIDPVSAIKSKKLPYLLEGVFFIKPDHYEMQALTDQPITSINDYFIAGKQLLKRGVQNIVISLGKLGYIIVNENWQKHYPAVKVKSVLDVSGAGDAFTAGILYGIQSGLALTDACEIAAKIAALTIQSYATVNDTIML